MQMWLDSGHGSAVGAATRARVRHCRRSAAPRAEHFPEKYLSWQQQPGPGPRLKRLICQTNYFWPYALITYFHILLAWARAPSQERTHDFPIKIFSISNHETKLRTLHISRVWCLHSPLSSGHAHGLGWPVPSGQWSPVVPVWSAPLLSPRHQTGRTTAHQHTGISSAYGHWEIFVFSIIQGVPYYWAHFVFCNFLGFWSTYRGTSDLYSTALEICYIIATRILKIDLEIA